MTDIHALIFLVVAAAVLAGYLVLVDRVRS
jgi:hypothetical protein